MRSPLSHLFSEEIINFKLRKRSHVLCDLYVGINPYQFIMQTAVLIPI